MGLFNFIKKKSNETSKKKEICVEVKSIIPLTNESIKITFQNENIPIDYFSFKAGQYTNIKININNKTQIRSYSLCSKPKEEMAIAIKAIPNGLVSNYLKNSLKPGDEFNITKPDGNFHINEEDKKICSFAAGSGITPIFSIANDLENSEKKMRLYYGNKSIESTIFYNEIKTLKNTESEFCFSQNSSDDIKCRIDGEFIRKLIKKDPELLNSDKFLICGPENMLIEVRDALKEFDVNESKIIYELFTAPIKMETSSDKNESKYIGESQVDILLDGKNHQIIIPKNGPFILDVAEKKGIEVPFSCRGGLCCSCRAKVIEGDVIMKINHALTDKEVSEGYTLACQAIANSSKIKLNFDE